MVRCRSPPSARSAFACRPPTLRRSAVGFAPLGTAWAAYLIPVIGILAVAVVYWVIKGTDEKPAVAATAAAPARA